jgi:CPA2 family monovalent cation:H+ antiporter-2
VPIVEATREALDAAWIKDVFVFLGAAGLVVPLFHRARIGAVLGFLVVGLIVGPYGLGRLVGDYPWIQFLTISDPKRVEPFAELGVIFLLFLLGLELTWSRLWQLRRYVLGVGGMQVALSALAIGAAVALAGASREAAIVLGLSLALSSTAIVMQLLRDQHRSATALGRLALSILLFQDLMVVPILFVTGMFGADAARGFGTSLALALGQAAVAIALIMAAGRFLARRLLRFVVATGSRDLIMAVTVLIVVAAAGGTGAAGLTTALGAFLAGLLLGETESSHQIETDLEPFKGILLGLFFVTVGMTIDLREAASNGLYVILAVVALLAIKAGTVFGAARMLGVSRVLSLETAIVLAQAGEFAFVIVALGRANGLLPPGLAQFVTVVVGISMVLTPLLALGARRLAGRSWAADHAAQEPPGEERELQDHVLIAGFGRVGRTIASILEAEHIDYVAIDSDGALVTRERKRGVPIHFGDATRPEILERVGAERSRAFVVTLDDASAVERLVAVCAGHWPGVPIFARAKDTRHAAKLAERGAVVVPEAVEASLQLAARVLERLDMTEDQVSQRIALAREAELGRLRPREAARGRPRDS